MTEWADIALLIVLVTLALGGWVANLIGLPGNWFNVAMAAASYLLVPSDSRVYVGLPIVLLAVAFAALGEAIEFLAGAVGAKRAGGTLRSTVLAMGGSMAGGLAGLFVGGALIPIPGLGSVLGAILLGAAGAFVGAIVGERWAGRDWNVSVSVGSAAFWGRLFGTVGKVVCGTGVAIAVIVGVCMG
ncbi:MAG: DUF456 domain-containing protein [Planctomycetota bacterium]|nr:MAG: DUF456 domain-containing protein [Planctomycetota bacterium]